MSSSALPQARVAARPAISRVHTSAIIIAAVLLSLLTLYAVFIGQATFLHEFAHDGRHLFGAPCH